MKGNLFGANTVVGAVALAVVALPSGNHRVELTAESVVLDTGSVVSEKMAAADPVACATAPYAITKPRPGVTNARGDQREVRESTAECGRPDVDTLRYLIPGPPGAMDFGPPIET
jgi:hypothetical protein